MPEVSAVGGGGAGRSWPEVPPPLGRTWGSERALSQSGRPLGHAVEPQGLAKAPPRRHPDATQTPPRRADFAARAPPGQAEG